MREALTYILTINNFFFLPQNISRIQPLSTTFLLPFSAHNHTLLYQSGFSIESEPTKWRYKYRCQFNSVQLLSCVWLYDPIKCSTPGLPVHHQLRVYSNSCTLSWWWHPTISSFVVPFSSCLQSFPASGSFPMSQLFASGGQSIRGSASASVIPMNTEDWFPLQWTGWISLLSKGLSDVGGVKNYRCKKCPNSSD